VNRFANTDYALAHAIRQQRFWPMNHDADDTFFTACEQLLSYDISCSYHVNAIKRFEKNFVDLVPAMKSTRYLVPLVHVQNHKDNCSYQYSSAYTPNAGHFHGETAEHTWAELNQIGTQTRQMNNGHRQDCLIDHSGDWNFKKLSNMGESGTSQLT